MKNLHACTGITEFEKSFTENGKADSLLLAFSSPSTVADIELVEGGGTRLEWFSLRQKSKMR
jgi:hypothetical protein